MRCVDIPRDVGAPRAARLAVTGLVDELGDELLDDVTLLVSELVTNSVRHGEGDTVRLLVDVPEPGLVRCAVVDAGGGFTPVERPATRRLGGWGLGLVDAVADTWGVRAGDTHVWFELAGR